MIIHNFNIAGAIIFPTKTNTPLPVDSNAVLPCPITGQRLQPVAAQSRQVLQYFCISKIRMAKTSF